MIRAFVTGSHAYGTPRDNSDIDLVVLVEPESLALLRVAVGADPPPASAGPDTSASLMFGKLNLVVVRDEREFQIWRDVTAELALRRPVDQATAKALLCERLAKPNTDLPAEAPADTDICF